MLNRRWLTLAIVVLALGGASACGNYNYSCIATCDGAPFSGYSGGTINASSTQNAVNMCVSALQAAGCTTPKVPVCACTLQ
jgi:hypothetical protein